MPLIDYSTSFRGGPGFYTGAGTTNMVPDVFPVALNGRPYMVDLKSGRFTRQFDSRVRDSSDNSTSPGESAINPQGLWRRGESSWHWGAGQKRADTSANQDYRFFKSKGVNVWTRGELTLLNATKRALESASTNLHMVTVSSGGTDYLYVADGTTLKYTTDPFASTPTWTPVTTGAPSPAVAITGLTTNGVTVFIGYTGKDIYSTSPGSSSVASFYPTSGTSNQTYTALSHAKGWNFAAVNQDLYVIGLGSGGHSVYFDNPDTTFRWVGADAGPNFVYAAGYSGRHSLIYRLPLKTDATGFDPPIVALELPHGEIVSSIYGYLGNIFIGSNKGVRMCTATNDGSLTAGSLIPTTGSVYDFASDERYVWFGWSNYDGSTGGLGRMDLSIMTATNTPSFATDLMYASTNDVLSVTSFGGKRVFSVSGVGVIVEDTANLVTSGSIETGTYQWGIPDRKFIPRFDIRTGPLVGSVSVEKLSDDGEWDDIGSHSDQGDTEHTFIATEEKVIETRYRISLARQTATTGPTFKRWMARAYAAPARSQLISVPLLVHNRINVRGKDYFFDVEQELDNLRDLVAVPRVVTYQEKGDTFSVIVEDVEWQVVDGHDRDWLFEGTATVIMRTVTE